MKNRISVRLIAALLIVTALAAAWHFHSQPRSLPGAVSVFHEGRSAYVQTSGLPVSRISGTVVNGKGETRDIDADGIRLSDLLEKAGIDTYDALSVIASDEYRAVLAPDDLPNAVLLPESDDRLRLIVFGDPDSKRNVSDVVRIEVQ